MKKFTNFMLIFVLGTMIGCTLFSCDDNMDEITVDSEVVDNDSTITDNGSTDDPVDDVIDITGDWNIESVLILDDTITRSDVCLSPTQLGTKYGARYDLFDVDFVFFEKNEMTFINFCNPRSVPYNYLVEDNELSLGEYRGSEYIEFVRYEIIEVNNEIMVLKLILTLDTSHEDEINEGILYQYRKYNK